MEKQQSRFLIKTLLLQVLFIVSLNFGRYWLSLIISVDPYLLYFNIIFYILFLAILIFIVKHDKEMNFKDVGIAKVQNKPINKMFAYIPLVIILLYISTTSAFLFHNHLSVLNSILFAIDAIVVGIVEEIFFRGFYKHLCRKKSISFYVLLSSILFSLSHYPKLMNYESAYIFIYLANAFLIGIMLSLIFVYIKSLFPLIIFHSAFNLLSAQLYQEQILILFSVYILAIIFLYTILHSNKKQKSKTVELV